MDAHLRGRPDLVSRLDLSLEPGENLDQICRRLTVVLADRAQVATPEQHGHWVEEMLVGLRTGLTLCGVGAMVVGLFLVANVLAVSAAERRHEVGLLKSLGARRWQIVALFIGEAGVLGLAGAALGVPLGLGLAQLALGPIQQVLSDVFLPVQTRSLDIEACALLGATGAGLATALLAAAVPALCAASLSPVEALRRAPVRSVLYQRRVGGFVGLGLLVCGIASLVLNYLPLRLGVYGNLVFCLLAALLLAPLLVTAMAWWLQPVARRLLGTTERLAFDNLVRAPGRTGLVITATAAGVALLVQTSGFIGSNEKSVKAWIDHSLAGDLFVTSGGPLSTSGQNLPMPDIMARSLEEVCPAAQVVPVRFRYLNWQRDGRPSRVLLLALDADCYYKANRNRSLPPPDRELYGRLREPGTALVSQNFANLYGISPGDLLTLPGAEGPVVLRVIGTVVDYSCNRGTILVDRCQYRQHFDAHLADAFEIYLPTGADAKAVRQRIRESALGEEKALCILTRDEVRGHILGMVRGLYGLAYAQEFMVALVAILGMTAALLIAVLQRRRELGLLRAVGARPIQIFRSVLAEAVIMATLGTVIGLLAGVPLEWYTVRVVLFKETGLLFPIYFPWATAGTIVCLALASATLASIGPAMRAARMGIVEAIGYE